MPIYELHEVTLLGDSANIDLNNAASAKFAEYSKNDQGTFILNKNVDLSLSRRIVNLNVVKSTQLKFNQVIDIEFEEFAENVNDPTKFLENKLQALEEARAKLLAESNSDKDLIRRLQEEIDKLRGVNKVPDTLTARNVLYADRTGKIGVPGYPKIENKLLSKGRKAMGIIQNDGNFVIYLGNFDEFGNEIRNTKIDQFGNTIQEPSALTAVAAFGFNRGTGTPGLKFQIEGGKGNLIVFRLNDQTYWEALDSKSANLSYASKIVLDDNGILTLYDGSTEKWSTKNLDPPKVSTKTIDTLKDLIREELKPWFKSTYVSNSTDPTRRRSVLIDGESFKLEDATTSLTNAIETLKLVKQTELANIEPTVVNILSTYITFFDTVERIAPEIAANIKQFIG